MTIFGSIILVRIAKKEDPRYTIFENDFARFDVPYQGLAEPLEVIPAGTILRFSLTRRFPRNEQNEAYWLQLSGWFLDEGQSPRPQEYLDDLPF